MPTITKLIYPTLRLTTRIVEKNMPKILTGVAIGASAGACVSTGVATWRSKDIIEDHNERVRMLKDMLDSELNTEEDIEDIEREIRRQNLLTAGELACEYALPVALFGGTAAASIGSASIFSSRIAAMALSYATLSKLYSDYRHRVADAVGVEKEDEIFKGITEEEIEYTDKNGKTKKKKVKKYTNVPLGQFCVFWIMGQNKYSQDDPVRDLAFIESVEEQITNHIMTDNCIFLDDAFKAVGIDIPDVPLAGNKAKEAAELWHTWGKIKSLDRIEAYEKLCEYDGTEPSIEGYRNVNRFSFGISDEQKTAFLNGDSDGLLLLCPNIDGDIFTNSAFLTQRDADVLIPDNVLSSREYE